MNVEVDTLSADAVALEVTGSTSTIVEPAAWRQDGPSYPTAVARLLGTANIGALAPVFRGFVAAHHKGASGVLDGHRGVSAGRADNKAAAAHAGMRAGMAARFPAWGDGDPAVFARFAREAAMARIASCLAKATRSNYATGARKLVAFCFRANVDLLAFMRGAAGNRAAAEEAGAALMLAFIGWLGKCRAHSRGDALLSPGTVRTMAYGGANMVKELTGGVSLTSGLMVKRVLSRLKKEYQAGRKLSNNFKLPLLPRLLRQVIEYAIAVGTEATRAYADAAILSLFFGLRVSELMLTSVYNEVNTRRQLPVGGLTVFRRVAKDTAAGEEVEVAVSWEEIGDIEADELTAVRIRLGPDTKGVRARERKLERPEDGGVLDPVAAAHRTLARAKTGGRGPADMAFYAGDSPMKAGAAPPRSKAAAGAQRTNGGEVSDADIALEGGPWPAANEGCGGDGSGCGRGPKAGDDRTLVQCATCNLVFHRACIVPPMPEDEEPSDNWVEYGCFASIMRRKGEDPETTGAKARAQKAERKGRGYRGFLFDALDKGPNGNGCFLETKAGRERVDPRRYSSHSARAAFATVLFCGGVSPVLIKDLGDWRSWCVLDYRRGDADRFAGIADVIANAKIDAPSAENDA